MSGDILDIVFSSKVCSVESFSVCALEILEILFLKVRWIKRIPNNKIEIAKTAIIKNNAKNEGGIKMSYIEVIHEFKRYKMEEKRLITLKKLAVFFLKIN